MNFYQIIDNLYLGNLDSIKDNNLVNILSCIINISNERNNLDSNLNIQQLNIFIKDEPNENISDWFNTTFNLIDEYLNKKKNVLVYCKIGKSRSVTIILNYLMTKDNLSYELAFIKLLKIKSEIGPNQGFIDQLKRFRKEYLGDKYQVQKYLDQQILKEYKFNLNCKLKGKKNSLEWENQRKDREIQRYLDSIDE